MLSDLYIKQTFMVSFHNTMIFAVSTRPYTTDRDMLTSDYNSVIRTESIVLLGPTLFSLKIDTVCSGKVVTIDFYRLPVLIDSNRPI